MKLLQLFLMVLAMNCAFAQIPSAATPDPNQPRILDAYNTVFIEEMTWLEVRDAMRAGKTTAIVATGGVEQNGPYLATGKHNFVLRATTEAIARKLGNALVAPIVAFVPEGDIQPPAGHMLYPGTISLSQKTFRLLLIDIASSLKTHGFKHIVFIGDSGGNQTGMKLVADSLSRQWDPKLTAIHFIPEYYTVLPDTKWLTEKGVVEKDEGLHDDYSLTATIMTVNPEMVRMKERIKAGKFSINGVQLAPAEKTIKIGKQIVEFRTEKTVEAINKAIAEPKISSPEVEIDFVKVSPNLVKVLFENEYVRVLEYSLKPGEKDNPHTHPPKSSYVISGGLLRVYPENGKPFDAEETKGASEWSGRVGKHYVENIGKTTVTILLTEIKSAH
jgi:creatinine amidohydrolase/Fe(II)-dependent formamide hydrolase-like protein